VDGDPAEGEGTAISTGEGDDDGGEDRDGELSFTLATIATTNMTRMAAAARTRGAMIMVRRCEPGLVTRARYQLNRVTPVIYGGRVGFADPAHTGWCRCGAGVIPTMKTPGGRMG
jgi:hypothetical protein